MGESQQQAGTAVEAGTRLLAYIQRFNWILLAVLIAGAWYVFSWPRAQSVLIGGLLANISFFFLRRDVAVFMDNFSQAGMSWQAVKSLVKVNFFVKFYGRLAVLALVLYLLITRVSIDVIGLIVGLSTIMFSIIVVVIGKGSMLYSAQRFKGA
ncbi:MAG TPA: hypothetical protein ENN06_05315 [Desulfobacteraceae bacterium]|nr:hypothetical protein [Desulfobacteraceae bacterium]